MKHTDNYVPANNGNWQDPAIRFLLKHTQSFRDAIERFVHLYWDNCVSDEENLLSFEDYAAGLAGVSEY